VLVVGNSILFAIMTNQEFLSLFAEQHEVKLLHGALQKDIAAVYCQGLTGSAAAVILGLVASKTEENALFILDDKEQAAYFYNDLQNLFPNETSTFFFPESTRVPYDFTESDQPNFLARSEVLDFLATDKKAWVVTYPKALAERVPVKKDVADNTFKLAVGQNLGISFLRDWLMEYGFDRVDFVVEPGQFAIRGGIVDIFSFASENPFRLEFFGDEVESIRAFNPADQLSVKTLNQLTLMPNVDQILNQKEHVSLMEYMGTETCLFVQSEEIIAEELKKLYQEATKQYDIKSVMGEKHSIPDNKFIHPTVWSKELKHYRHVEFGLSSSQKDSQKISFDFKEHPAFNKQFDALFKNLQDRKKNKQISLVFFNQTTQIERLVTILKDVGGTAEFIAMPYALSRGFVSDTFGLACYTDHQIFDRYNRFRLKEGFRQAKQALTLKEIYNLNKGDYVTHIDHGVGQFSGLEMIDVNGKQQEAVRLVYRDGDVLYVSIHSLHRISKFTSQEGAVPKMNKLGTQAWATLKNKTKKRIKELAFDLIQLYAKRKSQPGFAYAPDTYLQHELEASFEYEDTPDQLKATLAVKKDMESETPMDRLICGDVGFGKTEIAIRAAFKAVADNKQVAILVPTTVLCSQHARTFKKRLEDFPCTVDHINRFRSAKDVTEITKKLKEGKIDIIIGTHKIVGERVKFKDLGLIIIDEEQKFGVSVKDKLKLLKESVDTLTLTATPIPRTLQFSLMGARDLSVLNTPPANRQPILTERIGFDPAILKDALEYELSRGGQIFFVNNRLNNMPELAEFFRQLVPGIRVAIGHGQMDGKDLEKVMMDFIDHKFDMLLSTTIIESGIDVSNANTMIINEAQNFGLSDLHQMRGRVGRSNKKGFCYLITPPFTSMTSEARKRIEALIQFSDLGSGFYIAMKDLDIRGAGNMLGAEQSGFINDIGFEMYQKILNEAMQELRQNEFKTLFQDSENDQLPAHAFVGIDCALETDFEIRIPDTYVNSVNERLCLYQELDQLKTQEELDAYGRRLEDRFGPLPQAVCDMLESINLRWLAEKIGFERLVLKGGKMLGYFPTQTNTAYFQSAAFGKVLDFIQANPRIGALSEKNGKLRLVFDKVENIRKAIELLKLI
jgi:transcription-repair coupling factor (superfamily II helicase)